MSYISFDHLADRFAGQIYGTTKGRVRQALIEYLYSRYLPDLTAEPPLRVLDAGGGLGQMSGWLVEQGHHVDYFDVSPEMVRRVGEQFSEAVSDGRLTLSEASVFDFQAAGHYDLVVLHAVLEWLEDPQQALHRALTWVKPEGVLGVMVYNRHMLALRNLMRGTLAKVRDDRLGGDGRGLTPISPLDPAEVRRWIEAAGFDVVAQAGIRTFTDLTEPAVLGWYEESDIVEMEKRLCEQAPYRDLGRYVLFLVRPHSRSSDPTPVVPA